MPRLSAASAARHNDGRSPCSAGIRTGVAPVSAAIRARARAAPQLFGRGRVDADLQAGAFELAHRVLQMRKRRVGQATEVDHVGARRPHRRGARQDGLDGHRRDVDDFGKDAHVVTREVEVAAVLAEIGRQVLHLLRPALERHAELGAKAGEIGAAAARHQDAVGVHRARQPARDDRLGHQRRDLHADVEDRPFELGAAESRQNLLQARPCQVTGEEQDALNHLQARACGARASARARRGSRPRRLLRTTSGARCFPGRCGAETP
jgi:hypothetical protein